MIELAPLAKPLADYAKLSKCGSGAFSSVYKFRHRQTGQIVAAKRVSRDVDKPSIQQMVHREILILSSLQHPAILPMIGYSLPDSLERGSFHILTEFMPNGNVQQWEGYEHDHHAPPQFDATCKSKIIFGVAVAMAHIHERRIIHRDLKAENIFLDERWEPRVADFGLAKVVDRELLMSGVMGTPFFMAPELFDANGSPGFPIDVYSYAVIVLSLFTNGQFKFPRAPITGMAQLATQLGNGERFVIPENVKDCYRTLIEACWVHSAIDRMTFPEVVNALKVEETYVDGTNLEAFNEYRRRLLAFNREKVVSEGEGLGESTDPFKWE